MKYRTYNPTPFKKAASSKWLKAASELLVLLMSIEDNYELDEAQHLRTETHECVISPETAKYAVAMEIFCAVKTQESCGCDIECSLRMAGWDGIDGLQGCWEGAELIQDTFRNIYYCNVDNIITAENVDDEVQS